MFVAIIAGNLFCRLTYLKANVRVRQTTFTSRCVYLLLFLSSRLEIRLWSIEAFSPGCHKHDKFLI